MTDSTIIFGMYSYVFAISTIYKYVCDSMCAAAVLNTPEKRFQNKCQQAQLNIQKNTLSIHNFYIYIYISVCKM